MTASAPSAAIIGGGYAGMAAAVRLAQANIRVQVFESAHTLGGRARAIRHREQTLDNGQHILIGAYTSLLALMGEVGVQEHHALLRMPLEMNMHPEFHLRTPSLPAPLHLAWGLLTARGLSLAEKISATRLARLVEQETLPPEFQNATVAQLLKATHQPDRLVRLMWLPLCVAALNTPIETASARTFARVMRDALFNLRAHSDFLLPRVDLTRLFPQPAADWLADRGHAVHLGRRVRQVSAGDGTWMLETRAGDMSETHRADVVIVAVGPHQLDSVAGLPAELPRPTRFEPICTVYLQFGQPLELPTCMTGRASGMVQWFFQRSRLGGPAGLIAGVISASGPHEALDRDGISQAALAELREIVGDVPAPEWTQVVTERFATFACTPDVQRASAESTAPGLFLAGDHTEGPYPATLEGAVRSGERAAACAIRYLRSTAPA